MKFGCCIPVKLYQDAEQVGFDYVEFSGVEISAMSDTDFCRTVEMVRGGTLPCIALNSFSNGVPAMVGTHFCEDDVAPYAEHLCKRAAVLGARVIGIGVPDSRKLPANFDRAIADQQCRTFLSIVSAIAYNYNITVNFEQINIRMCDYGTTTSESVALIRELGQDNLALVVDFFHRAAAGESIIDFTGFQALIRHTHISTCGENLERGYPGMEDLTYYAQIIHALKNAGYDATMSIEATTDCLLRDGAESLKMLHRAEFMAERGIDTSS